MTSILSTSQISAAAPKGKAAAATPGQEPPAGDFAAMMEEATAAALPGATGEVMPSPSPAKTERAEKRKAAHAKAQSSADTPEAPSADARAKEKAEGGRSRKSTREARAESARPAASLMDMPIRMPNTPIDQVTVTAEALPPAATAATALDGAQGVAAATETMRTGKQPIQLSGPDIAPDAPARYPGQSDAETPEAVAQPAPASTLQPGDATALLRLLTETLGVQAEGVEPANRAVAPAAVPRAAPQLSLPAPIPAAAQDAAPVQSASLPLPAPATAEKAATSTPQARAGEAAPVLGAVSPAAAGQSSGKREGDSQRSGPEARRAAQITQGTTPGSAAPTPLPFAPASDAFVVRDASPVLSTADVGVFLGQQSLDLQIGGRWMDDLSREIAQVSAQGGHGSFRLATDRLGEMRVELTPGTQGTDVRMLVDNDDAKAALDAASGQLTQDAQLSAVRIGEVRVDRVAASADTRGTDTGGQQQGQGNQGNPAFSASGQQAGQGQGQSSRQALDAALSQGNAGNGGSQPKTSGSAAVNQDTARGEPSTRADGLDDRRARYA